MKKKLVMMLAIVTLLSGCGKIPKLSNGEDAVVSFEDGSMISVNELYNEMKNDYATNILITMIDRKILEAEYEDKIEDSKEYAKNYVESLKKYYVNENGEYDEQSLLSAISTYYGYNTLEEFEESVRINYLRNKAIDDYVGEKLTDKEIEKYYKDEIVGDRDTYHIQIVPDVKTSMTDAEKKEAEEKALNEAKALIARLKKGESFEDLAKENSDDEATKEKGGSLGFINKGSNGSEEFDKALYNLKVGDFTETPVKTTNGYEIIYVKEEKEKKSLEDAKDEIKKALINQKLEADATLQITAITELRKKNGVEIVDSEIEKNYNKYINNLMDAAKKENVADKD
ncbi:MAG: hypothetical protein HFG33_02125 [Bacilli bacterium]|nr:hypothetical protein [Bacilli bacterium]